VTVSQITQPLVIITGPTASGKSDLALQLASQLNGEIVSCDSVQVYRGFDIGSAKLNLAERKSIPHHLIDIVDPNQNFSVAEFVQKASNAIQDIESRNKTAIVCGGTTLYLTHLLHGLAELPPAAPELRAKLEALSNAELFRNLSESDPIRAEKLHINDRVRLIRALEAIERLNEPVSKLHAQHAYNNFHGVSSALVIILCNERKTLYEKINLRSKKMIDVGLFEETSRLIDSGYANCAPIKALGYKQASEFINGQISKEQLIEDIAKATRNYAKRQLTFFRNEPIKRGWKIRPNAEDEFVCLDDVLSIETGKKTKIKSMRALHFSMDDLLQEVKNYLDSERQGVKRQSMKRHGIEAWYVQI
jgi:tRNA dimethylallyltransferase